MRMEVSEHSIEGWKAFAASAGFVPDPMILRTGEVFVNGLTGVKALAKPDLEVWSALKENIAGLTDFFDLLVTRDRIPLIDYGYTFDADSVISPLANLLGEKALPVTVDSAPYEIVKRGAFNSLARIELSQVQTFAGQLRELDSLRYDWQPHLEGYQGAQPWLRNAGALDEDTARAARFLLGGFIFSGFAQASGTDHYIQPKRSRFFLSLTSSSGINHPIGHEDEQPIFDDALGELGATNAKIRRLEALPPVLPHLIANAPPDVTAADLLRLALAFPQTPDGRRYCAAAAALRQDGVRARDTENVAFAAHEEALARLGPQTRPTDRAGGFEVEFSVGLDGPKLGVSTKIGLPTWLERWWNDQTPFGSVRKTFRRMWMEAEAYQQFERQIRDVWARS